MKYWRGLLIVGLAAFTLYCAGLMLVPGEYSNLTANSLKARLVLPSALRELPQHELCKPALFSTQFLECAGVCGSIYTAAVSTEIPLTGLDHQLGLSDIAAQLGATSYDVLPVSATEDCPAFQITFVRDERLAALASALCFSSGVPFASNVIRDG